MNTLKYMAFITLMSCGQSIWAMQEESAKPNYCHDAIQKIKSATAYDPISLLNILGIQDTAADIFENRYRVQFIVGEVAKFEDVDQNKKHVLQWFKDVINAKANAYGKANILEDKKGEYITKERCIKEFQGMILETAKKYAHTNYLPLEACPAQTIAAKAACIQKLRAASSRQLVISEHGFLTEFLNIPTHLRPLDDVDEEVYRKQRDILAILDEVRLNPSSTI
jgi:hypothetical protein